MTRYDALIVGGGIAGLQAAIQLGRYMHKVVVIDAGGGRSALCRQYSNLLGWPDGVSGPWLRQTGRAQAERLGVAFVQAEAAQLTRSEQSFAALDASGRLLAEGKVALLATGITDHIAPLPGLERCLGLSVYICPDCDGYEVLNRHAVIMGAGNAGAHMAIAVDYWARQVTYINHTCDEIEAELVQKLRERDIVTLEAPIAEVSSSADGHFQAALLADGRRIDGDKAFVAFGGGTVRTGLARELGAEYAEHGHLIVDPRTKQTTVHGLWAAGDIGVHSQMLTVALGEGMLAAVWMHKQLMQQAKQTAKV